MPTLRVILMESSYAEEAFVMQEIFARRLLSDAAVLEVRLRSLDTFTIEQLAWLANSYGAS